jgi:hypothetical protein
MKKIYQIEMLVIAAGIVMVALFLMRTDNSMTGYISGANFTVFSQNLDMTVDGSQIYTLTTTSGENLHMKSFFLDGKLVGKGRAEILLDNGKGQQFLVYENKKKKSSAGSHGITGAVTKDDLAAENVQEGVWLVVQPSNIMNYEFLPLKEDEELVEGIFSSACVETCKIPEGLFDSSEYRLVFRLEQGTTMELYELDYSVHEDQ